MITQDSDNLSQYPNYLGLFPVLFLWGAGLYLVGLWNNWWSIPIAAATYMISIFIPLIKDRVESSQAEPISRLNLQKTQILDLALKNPTQFKADCSEPILHSVLFKIRNHEK